MQTTPKAHLSDGRNLDPNNVKPRRAVGYVRVSTDMQATDGLSLDAQTIRLDSFLGRALVSILLVFAQMEREATAKRTRESVMHIRKLGYHHGKASYGFKA